MSSRELVDDLLGAVIAVNDDGEDELSAWFLPEDSALRTALRGGDWSDREYREARLINEIAAAHAAGRGWDPLLSPTEKAIEKAHLDWQKRRHDEALAELRGEK